MQAELGRCKAAGRCGIGAWGGRGGCGARMGVAGAGAAHPASILSSLPGRRGTRGRRCRRPLKCRTPGTSPGPTPATSAAPLTWARACTGRGYLPRKERAARLSWAKPPWRHDLRAWANFFLPVRASRPVGRGSVVRLARRRPEMVSAAGSLERMLDQCLGEKKQCTSLTAPGPIQSHLGNALTAKPP